jgi:hypothetical protein
MQDKTVFDPEKITLVEFRILKEQVDTPENFDISKVIGHHLDNSLQFGFNLNDKLAKADFTASIKTSSKSANESEASANVHLKFIYRIENLEELATAEKNKRLRLHPALASALSSLTYSTSRGILLIRLQGTALQNFILPIINSNNLLHKN